MCKFFHVGVYCGPLRLLAWEIAERMNKANVLCSLITGQKKREVTGAKHQAMTVEMADVTRHFECGVIDEIQVSNFAFFSGVLNACISFSLYCGHEGKLHYAIHQLTFSEADHSNGNLLTSHCMKYLHSGIVY
jgi:hypothetical protein